MASPSEEGYPTPKPHKESRHTRPELVTASLFVTCIVDQFYPGVGESTVRLLRRLGVDVDFPESQTCCGQPAYNAGFTQIAAEAARGNAECVQWGEIHRGSIGFMCCHGQGLLS